MKVVDKVPVPVSVVRAVEVMEALGANLPQFIFDFDNGFAEIPGVKRRVTKFLVYRNLTSFAMLLRLGADDNDVAWQPKPHQFRRFFAVLYFNRFRYPHMTALSVFLRHNGLEMTRRYVTESHRGSFIEEQSPKAVHQNLVREQDFFAEEQEFIVDRLADVADGVEAIGGSGGEAIKRRLAALVQDARARMELSGGEDLPRATLQALISKVAAEVRMDPHGSGHGYCKCTHRSEDVGVAACVGLGTDSGLAADSIVGPLSAFASDDVCSKCPHHVQFSENKSYWDRMWNEANQRLSTADSPIMHGHLKERMALCDAHLKLWFPEPEKP